MTQTIWTWKGYLRGLGRKNLDVRQWLWHTMNSRGKFDDIGDKMLESFLSIEALPPVPFIGHLYLRWRGRGIFKGHGTELQWWRDAVEEVQWEVLEDFAEVKLGGDDIEQRRGTIPC